MPLSVNNYYPLTLTIDGEAVRLRIKRFTRADDLWFGPTFDHLHRNAAAADDELLQFGIKYKKALADIKGVDVDKIPPPDPSYLVGLLEAELGTEKTAERRAAEKTRIEESNTFAREALGKFVTVEKGDVIDQTTGREVVNGDDLFDLFQARPDVIVEILASIRLENRLSAEQKKRLSELSASLTTSAPPKASGPIPDATAAAVESEGSAPSALVTAS